MNARRASWFLYLLGRINPQAWDAIIPHGPRVSAGSREYLIAMALKGLSAELENPAVVKRMGGVQMALVKFAAERIAADYDDDNWCPTPPKRPVPPGPPPGEPEPTPWFNFSAVMLNPQPLPPKELQKEIGGYLLLLSEATTVKEAAKELGELGKGLIAGK